MRTIKTVLVILGVLYLYEHLTQMNLDQTVHLAISQLQSLLHLAIQTIQQHLHSHSVGP